MPLRKEIADFATRLAALKKSSPAFQRDPDLPMDEPSRMFRAKVLGNDLALPFYHGTTHVIPSFKGTIKGDPQGYFGAADYLTSSPLDASKNYAGMGPDLTSRVERRANAIYADLADGNRDQFTAMEDAYAMAIKELVGEHEGVVMPLFLRGRTVDLRGDSPTVLSAGSVDDVAKFIRGKAEEYGFHPGAVRGIENEGPMLGRVVDDELRRGLLGEAMDAEGNMVMGDLIRRGFQSAGYDNILMDANKAFPLMDIPRGTTHAVSSDPANIRSRWARFDPDNIRSRDIGAGVAGASLIPAMMPTEAEAAPYDVPASRERMARALSAAIDFKLGVARPYDVPASQAEIDRDLILNQDAYTPRIRSGLSPLSEMALQERLDRAQSAAAYRDAADPLVGFGSMRESNVPLVVGAVLGAAAPLRVASMPRAVNALSSLARLLGRDHPNLWKEPSLPPDIASAGAAADESQAGLNWAKDQLGLAEGGAVNMAEGGNPDPYPNPWWRGLPAPIQPLSAADVMPMATLPAAGGTSPSAATIGGITGAAAGALPGLSLPSLTGAPVGGMIGRAVIGGPIGAMLGAALGTAYDVNKANAQLDEYGFPERVSGLSALAPSLLGGRPAADQAINIMGLTNEAFEVPGANVAEPNKDLQPGQTRRGEYAGPSVPFGGLPSLASLQAMGSPGLDGYGNLATPHSYGFVNGSLIGNWSGIPSRDLVTLGLLSSVPAFGMPPGEVETPETTTEDDTAELGLTIATPDSPPSSPPSSPPDSRSDSPDGAGDHGEARGGQVSFAEGGPLGRAARLGMTAVRELLGGKKAISKAFPEGMSPEDALEAARRGKHLNRKEDGSYVGLGSEINSPQKLAALRRRIDEKIAKGAYNSDWYRRQQDFARETSDDPLMRSLFARAGAAYSPQAIPSVELGAFLKQHNARMLTGKDVVPRTGSQSANVAQAYSTDPQGMVNLSPQNIRLGRKTGPYADRKDPTVPYNFRSPADVWVGRAFELNNPSSIGSASHNVLWGDLLLAAERANKAGIGKGDLHDSSTVQAAMWATERFETKQARDIARFNRESAKRDRYEANPERWRNRNKGKTPPPKPAPLLSDAALEQYALGGLDTAAPQHTAYLSKEAVPGRGLRHGPDPDLLVPDAFKDEYTQRISKAVGRDPIVEGLGLYSKPIVQTRGEFTVPGSSKVEHNRAWTDPILVSTDIRKKSRGTSPADREALRIAAQYEGVVGAQHGVGIGRILPEDTPNLRVKDTNAAVFDKAGMSAADQAAIDSFTAKNGLTQLDYGDRVLVVKFSDQGAIPGIGTEIRNSLRAGVPIKDPARFGRAFGELDYVPSKHVADEGTGAATEALLKRFNEITIPDLFARVDKTGRLQAQAAARNAIDQDMLPAAGLPMRDDIWKLRDIIARSGMGGLRDYVKQHGSKGLPAILPAAFLGEEALRPRYDE